MCDRQSYTLDKSIISLPTQPPSQGLPAISELT